jgi:hypothetical protein
MLPTSKPTMKIRANNRFISFMKGVSIQNSGVRITASRTGDSERMSEKYPKVSDPPQPPLLRGENLIKVPLFNGDLGVAPVGKRVNYNFSYIL